jgi:hypothetical protein
MSGLSERGRGSAITTKRGGVRSSLSWSSSKSSCGGVWVPVIRYDMAHGQAHIDVCDTPRRKRKQFLDLPPGEVMTLAEEDIKDNWERYQAEFLRRHRR